MTSLPQIQTRLREEFSNLCEACYSEHAWLEEGAIGEENIPEFYPTAPRDGTVTSGPASKNS